MGQSNENGFGQITKVERHHIETVNIYEVSDGELRELELSNDADVFLNIGLSCMSSSAAFLLSILTSSYRTEFLELLICCVTVIFGLAGVIMLILWMQKRKSKKSIIEVIRNRGSNKE